MIDDAIAERMLLATACEGGSGLYEAVWELNARFPDTSLSEKYRAAVSALRHLAERDLIEFYRENLSQDGDRRFEALDLSTDQVLEEVVNWYPEYAGVQIGFNATAEGEHFYLKQGAV